MKNSTIPIFLSRPNPFQQKQRNFLNALIGKIRRRGLNEITLIAPNYNPYESLNCLTEQIRRCYGMIIVAFGQKYIKSGISKPNIDVQTEDYPIIKKELQNQMITSPYCHIEGTLGVHNKLPILCIREKGVYIEGVLENGKHIIECPELDFDYLNENCEAYLFNYDFTMQFNYWLKQVKDKFDFVNVSKKN